MTFNIGAETNHNYYSNKSLLHFEIEKQHNSANEMVGNNFQLSI